MPDYILLNRPEIKRQVIHIIENGFCLCGAKIVDRNIWSFSSSPAAFETNLAYTCQVCQRILAKRNQVEEKPKKKARMYGHLISN